MAHFIVRIQDSRLDDLAGPERAETLEEMLVRGLFHGFPGTTVEVSEVFPASAESTVPLAYSAIEQGSSLNSGAGV